eukprot:COSAG04_NODE_12638_length_642_cov_1.226519_2_plen_58_part_01
MEPEPPASAAEEGAPERPTPSEREAARRERLAEPEPEGSSDEDTAHGGAASAPTSAGG